MESGDDDVRVAGCNRICKVGLPSGDTEVTSVAQSGAIKGSGGTEVEVIFHLIRGLQMVIGRSCAATFVQQLYETTLCAARVLGVTTNSTISHLSTLSKAKARHRSRHRVAIPVRTQCITHARKVDGMREGLLSVSQDIA